MPLFLGTLLKCKNISNAFSLSHSYWHNFCACTDFCCSEKHALNLSSLNATTFAAHANMSKGRKSRRKDEEEEQTEAAKATAATAAPTAPAKVASILRPFYFTNQNNSQQLPAVTDHGNIVAKIGKKMTRKAEEEEEENEMREKKAKVNHVVMLPCLNYNEKD